MFSISPASLELLSQLKLCELQAQAAPAQRPSHPSWFTRFQRWVRTGQPRNSS